MKRNTIILHWAIILLFVGIIAELPTYQIFIFTSSIFVMNELMTSKPQAIPTA